MQCQACEWNLRNVVTRFCPSCGAPTFKESYPQSYAQPVDKPVDNFFLSH
jgi:rRNA maturation endonuclease Nob1